jgi:allantoinase
MIDLLIRNADVVTAAGVVRADLSIDGGSIAAIGAAGGAARGEIDAAGCVVYPGLIDPHVHFNEPGRAHWEGIATGSSALVAGGGTAFFDMPLNSRPALLKAADFDAKAAAMATKSFADYALWGGLTPDNLDHLEALADCGVIGFKAFMSGSGIDDFKRADEATLRAGMKVAAARGSVVAVHAEDESMTRRLAAAARDEGRSGWRDYIATRPIEAEVKAIEAACGVALETRCKLHIVHVSSAAGVTSIRRAKAAGVDVTCETCPHYLLLAEDDLIARGASVKCAPPVRPEAEAERLWQCVRDGRIDFLASDHSPAPPEMKTADDAFAVWGGIAGVQSTLTAALTCKPALVPEQVAALCAANVAGRFGLLKKGRLEIGYDADLVIVDPRRSFVLAAHDLHDRHQLSPYVGRRFDQTIVRTILRGVTVFEGGQVIGPPRGRPLGRET